WDDPRMPTLSGLRRRGYTPESIRDFCERIGIAKRDNLVDVSLLEFCIREHLNKIAHRRMVVFDPIKVVITNYPAAGTERLPTENNPEDPSTGTREIPFSRELFIEQEDFLENPPKKFFRLSPGNKVRLKSAYIIQCDNVVKDEQGNIRELQCTYFPESKSGEDKTGLKVQGTLHWVNAADAVEVEVREYDRLFQVEDPTSEEGEFTSYLNPHSLKIVKGFAEPAIRNATTQDRFQFLRKGYYCLDKQSTPQQLVFNRTVTLKDAWAKEQKKA
ncbi:MAG: glutamate--tRNA ligase family protein, partial [Chitinophagaceae bacterium]